MSESAATIRVERLDHEELILEGLELARAFFVDDPSSIGERAYDDVAGSRTPDALTVADLAAINRTMRARSALSSWNDILGENVPWLANIPTDLDLLVLGQAEWEEGKGDVLLREAFTAIIGKGRGLAVATKMLHLKRPYLFPILDRFVAEMLGLNAAEEAQRDQRVDAAMELTRVFRREGRRNLTPLRAIQEALAADNLHKPLVRILDAILWFSHPAAGVARAPRVMAVRRRH